MSAASAARVGTIVVDGLIEGPLPPFEDGEDRLRQWVEFARAQSLRFDLVVDGPSFNLLATGEPVPAGPEGVSADVLRQTIEQLLTLFPEDLRARVFSTVRSVEHREQSQVQCVYVVTPTGVEARERTVARETGETPPAATPAPGRVRVPQPFLLAGAIVLVAFVFSLFVVDYGELWRSWRERVSPTPAAELQISAALVDRYVAWNNLGWDESRRFLQLEVSRTEAYPVDVAAFRAEEQRIAAAGDLREVAALRRVVIDGTLAVEYLGDEGQVLSTAQLSIRGLLSDPKVLARLPLRVVPGVAEIRLGF